MERSSASDGGCDGLIVSFAVGDDWVIFSLHRNEEPDFFRSTSQDRQDLYKIDFLRLAIRSTDLTQVIRRKTDVVRQSDPLSPLVIIGLAARHSLCRKNNPLQLTESLSPLMALHLAIVD